MVCRAEPETSGCVAITDHTLMQMKVGAIKAGSALTQQLNGWLIKRRTGHGLQNHPGSVAGVFPEPYFYEQCGLLHWNRVKERPKLNINHTLIGS